MRKNGGLKRSGARARGTGRTPVPAQSGVTAAAALALAAVGCAAPGNVASNPGKWANYRLGDLFYGHPDNHPPQNPPDSVGWHYARNRTKRFGDWATMLAAIDRVCGGRRDQRLPPHTAAMHLRLGDVLHLGRTKYRKYAPVWLYTDVVGHLAAAGITRVELFYHATRGSGKRYVHIARNRSNAFVATLTGFLAERGMDAVVATGGQADEHFCQMMAADTFVPSGGGYSKLIAKARAAHGIGGRHDLPPHWWCDEEFIAGAPDKERAAAKEACGGGDARAGRPGKRRRLTATVSPVRVKPRLATPDRPGP